MQTDGGKRGREGSRNGWREGGRKKVSTCTEKGVGGTRVHTYRRRPYHNHSPTRVNFTVLLSSPRQVCTGDSWATSVVRAMFYDEGKVEPLPTIFFVSYMLVASVVLINIVIAVLLVCLSSFSLLALFSLSLSLSLARSLAVSSPL